MKRFNSSCSYFTNVTESILLHFQGDVITVAPSLHQKKHAGAVSAFNNRLGELFEIGHIVLIDLADEVARLQTHLPSSTIGCDFSDIPKIAVARFASMLQPS